MAGTDVDSLVDRLAGTKVDSESGLSFAGKGIKLDNEADAGPIVEAIKSCQDLQWLRLEGNTMGIQAAKAIAKALESHSEFKRALWSDMFTGRLKSEIPDALRFLGSGVMLAGARLVELDLSDNAFGPNGMEGLVDFLSSESCFTLQELRLNNNGLGRTGGKMLSKSLLECHKKSSEAGTPLALRVFVSGRGRLENEGATCLAEAFKTIGTLEEVSMPQNGIFHEGITALADAFAQNSKLQKLDLNDNIFSEVGAEAMAKALPNLPDLTSINFGDCLLKTGGAQSLSKALQDCNPKLQEITLSFNEIEMPGASAVCKALAKRNSLTKLDLCGNELTRRQREKLQAIMEASGRGSVLIVKSDDDDSDEEDDDDDDDEEDGVSGSEGEDDVSQETPTQLQQQSADSKVITVEEFISMPSATSLLKMGNQRDQVFCQHLKGSQPGEAVSLLFKIASIVTSAEGDVYSAACQCADALLKKTLEYGEENVVATLANEILVNMGLLKCEDKKLVRVDNIRGCLMVLSHAVGQQYFPKLGKDIFIAFFSRSHPVLDSHILLKQQLLQASYK